jgi:euchromatic histone-lysine N-methyltransferase
VKKSPRNLARESGESVLASAIARKEKQNEHPPPALRNRSLRRIKPTAKILANEELRQGFEIQNCVRLSISTENLENMERSSPVKSPEIHHENKHEKKCSSENTTTKMDPPKPVKSVPEPNATHKPVQQQQPQQLKTTNLTIDNIYPKPLSKPCRSTEEFLKDIKDNKIGLHRSAEDNKKLNKKQQRKLFKMKIKHLSMLGLRRASKHNDDDEDSDSSLESESDTEEFVPTKFSKQDIAKPNITLRLRNQKSDKPSITPSRKTGTTIKRHKEADDRISEHDKRIKLSNENKADQSDDDCILVETPQAQTNFRNATGVSNGNGKENNHQNLICFCLQKTKYCIKQQQTLPFSIDGKIFCCAIDEIEKRKVGCTNELTESQINLYRPSVKVSYMILCPSHKKRLITHNCCSGCGIFCSQGTFVVCNNKHFFHRECAIKYILNTPYDPNNPHFTEPTLVLKCPHCGIDAPHFDYKVTMRCENVPVFVPHRNPLP